MTLSAPANREPLYSPLFAMLGLMRCALLVLTLVLDGLRLGGAANPGLVIAVGVAMTVSTAALTWAYARPERRRLGVYAADLVVTLGLTMCSSIALGRTEHWLPVTGFWAAAAPITLAVAFGWAPALIAASLLMVSIQLQHPDPRPEVAGLMVVLVIGAGALGYMVDRLRAATAEQERLRANAAAIAERQRLARIVHDGVLQVLALVEREGAHLGPRGVMLARHAREQEVELRAMLQDRDIDPQSSNPRDLTHSDYTVSLDRHASSTVTVSTPAEPLLMESSRARELDAVVSEVLQNVAKHAGPDARAWLFLEIEDGIAVLSVRDNGVGGDPNEFAAAMSRGRMGMKDSIYGRIHDLGGSATLRTAPGRGVEWEFRVPIEL